MSKKSSAAGANISSLLQEKRVFKPSKEFSAAARVPSMAAYKKLWTESVRQPDKFWGRYGKSELVWMKPFKKVLQWKEPVAKWFVGGQLNVSANCLDKWLGTHTANKAALIWEGEPAKESVEKIAALGLQSTVFAPSGNAPDRGEWLDAMQRNVKALERVAGL
jgi:acetyl-CoA synthetase